MKVLVCGAGQVGLSIARYLAEQDNDVTIIDHSPDVIQRINETMDVQALEGLASHPDVLKKAGVKDAEMLIAVTKSDEVNMVACQVAYSLFKVPMKIARIREKSYLDSEISHLYRADHMPIDVIISPEIEVARAIRRSLEVPGAFINIPFVADRLKLVGIKCTTNSPVINTPLRHLEGLFPTLQVRVALIVRGEELILPRGKDQILPGDEVYLMTPSLEIEKTISAFGYNKADTRRIVIIGGGNIGLSLSQQLNKSLKETSPLIIEKNKKRAEVVANACPQTLVLHGDALDPDLLIEANVPLAETVVSVTDDDKVNILSALLAKRTGAQRVMALLNNAAYTHLLGPLGVDTVISPRALTVSKILQHVRRGKIRSIYSLREGVGEVIEAEVISTSSLVGMTLEDVDLIGGIKVIALARDGEVYLSHKNMSIKVHDVLVLMVTPSAIRRFEKLFSVRIGYFS